MLKAIRGHQYFIARQRHAKSDVFDLPKNTPHFMKSKDAYPVHSVLPLNSILSQMNQSVSSLLHD
jgi:hypothetical protein